MPRRKRRKTASPTILDYLNDDCWKCVLDYVDLKEVIHSELVSRQWQAMVLRYMQTVRLGLEEIGPTSVTPWPKVRYLELNDDDLNDDYGDWSSFKRWTEKLGSTVVAAFCNSESRLKILIKNCPNVESLLITGFEDTISNDVTTKCFQRLQRLSFRYSFFLTDRCVSQLINSSVTELDVKGNEEKDDYDYDCMDGRFLSSVKSKLESLTLIDIELKFHYLHSIIDWLSDLKRLHLSILQHVFESIHLVLEKTPKLEHLHLDIHTRRELDLSQHVCRLANLRHLSGNAVWTDENLDIVTRCCKELRTLEIKCKNEISVRGLEAMVRNAGARLVALDLGSNSTLTDDDMKVCFRGCTKLTTLQVTRCRKLSWQRLRELAEEARRGLRPPPPPLLLLKNSALKWIIE